MFKEETDNEFVWHVIIQKPFIRTFSNAFEMLSKEYRSFLIFVPPLFKVDVTNTMTMNSSDVLPNCFTYIYNCNF